MNPNEVTRWLDYPEEIYTIEPGEGVERQFSISVPENTRPGQYLTSLVFEDAESRAIAGSQNFQQLIRFAVPVFITVPGPVETGFEVGEPSIMTSTDASELSVTITNVGDVRVRPSGTITISRENGELLFEAPVGMGSVFARDSTSLVIGIPTLQEGNYRILIELVDLETNTFSESESVATATAPDTAPPPLPVQFAGASASPEPSTDDLQFLDVSVSIENIGETINNGRLTLRVTKDGESVENYPIATSLSIPSGSIDIEERCIPAGGWSAGTWEFSLTLESVEPGNGVATVLATAELEPVVVS